MTTTIRLRGPADIITVLPYHLGYRPADSLVLVLLDGPRIGMVARIDLPPPEVDPALLVAELLPHVLRERPDRVVLVGFETRADHAEVCSRAMRVALLEVGLVAVERLLVRGGRWWCLDCDGGCCPPDGDVLPCDDEVPAVSDYVVLGRYPAASRERLADRLVYTEDPVQDARCAAIIHELEAARRSARTLHRRRRRVLEAWGRILGPGQQSAAVGSAPRSSPGPASRGSGVSEEDWAWAVVGLLDIAVRDLVITWLCPGTLQLDVFPLALRRLAAAHLPPRDHLPTRGSDDRPRSLVEASDGARVPDVSGVSKAVLVAGPPDGLDGLDGRDGLDGLDGLDDAGNADGELVERLAQACRRSPPELSPGPLTVLGHVAWWLGDGALARTAVERALDVDPDYRLAALLERMVDAAARPRRTA